VKFDFIIPILKLIVARFGSKIFDVQSIQKKPDDKNLVSRSKIVSLIGSRKEV